MRTAVTIAYEHGSGNHRFLFGPDTPLNEQVASLKQNQSEEHPLFQRIEVWESDGGVTKYRKFKPELQATADEPKKKGKK